MTTINVARDFSRFPGGRYRTDGPFSGQEFRDDILVPALATNEHVAVEIDGVAGLPVSFLEEAFGGLVRLGFSKDELFDRLDIVARTSRVRRYPSMILDFISTAAAVEQKRAV